MNIKNVLSNPVITRPSIASVQITYPKRSTCLLTLNLQLPNKCNLVSSPQVTINVGMRCLKHHLVFQILTRRGYSLETFQGHIKFSKLSFQGCKAILSRFPQHFSYHKLYLAKISMFRPQNEQ